MMPNILIVFFYFVCVSGNGIFHVNSKTTYYPDSAELSEYFGYSVVLGPYGVIVGAPKAMNREKLVPTGLIFNCTTDGENNTCSPVEINGRDQYFERFRKIMPDNFFRKDMWFGATMGALTDGKLLICAPRFSEPYNEKHLLANGVCYIRRKDRDVIIYPLRDKSLQAFRTDGKRREYGEYGSHLNYYAYGQAGVSVKVTGNNSVIIGAPGLLQWAGGIVNYVYSPDENSNYFSQQPTSNPYFTKDIGPDDYFGYSVESGVFQKDGPMLYVGGAPRSKMGYGQVLVFEPVVRERDALNVRAKLRGPQLGSYFGAALCCLDIDGDGAADLLVGAPNHARKDGGLPYDQGAVFIYMTKQMNSSFILEASGFLAGSGASGARFGTTIADLGDVDRDGFRDVAIGAPWEDEGRGAVYIYRGHASGLTSQYNQRISPEGAGSFGISISRGLDVDDNHSNDVAIGAATSARVYVYRSIRTLVVRATVKVPDAMNLPHNATGFTALFCVTAPERPLWRGARAHFTAKISIDPEGNRAVLSGDPEYKATAAPGDERCNEQAVEVKPTADLSKPISIKFELEPEDVQSVHFNPYTSARVSEESELSSKFLIQLVRDCGEDMICTPWLVITLEPLDNPYIPGTDSKLGARLTILNKEEPAYGVRVNISLPLVPKRVPSSCFLEDLVMTCDVPAPLLRDQEMIIDVELEYNMKTSVDVILKVVAELEDSLYYRNISKDSVIELELEVTPEAHFNLTGKPLPNATITISRERLYDAENISFVHYVEVTNLGPSDWYDLEVDFFFNLMNLSAPVEGCEELGPRVSCTWAVPANVTFPVSLPLRLDLATYGELLEKNNTLNATTQIFLVWKDNKPDAECYISGSIMTTFELEPAPPLWPLVLGVAAGLLCGLTLLALIVYLLYKYGFFSRRQHQRLKEMQDQSGTENELEDTLEVAPSSTGATNNGSNNSMRGLLFEDSD